MIPNRVVQYYPETPQEAVAAHCEATAADLEVRYYGGGTEILTHARDGRIRVDALIDLKGIAGTLGIDAGGEKTEAGVRFGACEPLNAVASSAAFPLLSEAVSHIADRTVRNSITLGGNIAGRLPYREAVLPLLIAGARAELFGPDGARTVPLTDLFDKRLKTAEGEFLLALYLDAERADDPWSYRRRERDARVDYPLVTVCMTRTNGALRMSISGAYSAPLRSEKAEAALNATGSPAERAGAAIEAIGAEIRDDIRGSREYRRAVRTLAIEEMIEELAGNGEGGTR